MSKKETHNSHWPLPEHDPPKGIWDNISGKLDENPAAGGYSNALNSLPEHAPPPAVWDNIASGMGKAPGIIPVSTYKWLVPALLIIGVSILAYFSFKDGGDELLQTNPPTAEIPLINNSGQTETAISGSQDDEKLNSQVAESKADHLEAAIVLSEEKTSTETVQNNPSATKERVDNSEQEISYTNYTPNNFGDESSVASAVVADALLPLDNSSGNIGSYSPAIHQLPTISSPSIAQSWNAYWLPLKSRTNNYYDLLPYNKKQSDKKSILDQFAWGLHFGVETINIPGSDKNALAWHYDLSVAWKFSNGFIESGIGYSNTSCDESYEVDYLQNEVVLKYDRVDSIVYTLDTVNMQLDREYMVSDHEVYDSVEYQQTQQPKRISSYIQIPLLLGYKHVFKKSGLYAKTGVVLSIITNTYSDGIQLDDPQSRVTGVTPKLACPAETNWQYVLAVGYTIDLGKKFSLALEPQFRYYFGSYMLNNGGKSKNPYSLGIRAGIYYNF